MRSVELPGNAWPSSLAFSADGTLWITESSRGAIARLTPNGQLTHFQIPGDSTDPSNIIKGPDGKMWFTGFQVLGKIDAVGNITGWETQVSGNGIDLSLPSTLTLGSDGAVWYTNETTPPKINRITADGVNTSTYIPADDDASIDFGGITPGADNALWFTISPIESGAGTIGRITTDGQYKSWKLPSTANPTAIIPGPDGALWFTETRRIGRITTEGKISHFPLPAGAQTANITLGAGNAMWFTTTTGLGRITTTGNINQWPVPGAKDLGSLTVAPDGTLWLADRKASVLWHVTPPNTSN